MQTNLISSTMTESSVCPSPPPSTVDTSEAVAAPNAPKPTTPSKARAKRKRSVFGRQLVEGLIQPAYTDSDGKHHRAIYARFWYELRFDGLHVRRYRSRKAKVHWTFTQLRNGCEADHQMDMFPGMTIHHPIAPTPL